MGCGRSRVHGGARTRTRSRDWGPARFWPLKLAPNETHLQPDVGGKVGDVQLQCVQGGSQLWGDARQGLQEALVEKEAAVQLV